jgi:hypothetical protein
MIRALSLLALLAGALAPLPALPAAAQTPAVSRNQADLNYPQSIRFELELAEGVTLTSATITYDVIREGCVDAATHVPVLPDGAQLSYEWIFTRSGNPPPGAQVWWEWQLTDAVGNRTTTSRQTITLTDDRFDWRLTEAAGIRLHWYQGDEVGPALLDAATEALGRLQVEMGIQLQETVDIFVYGSSADMRDAVLFVQDWAGALAFADYNTILMSANAGNLASWGKPTIAHELAHLVIGQFGRSCVGGSRPTWLEEGLAMVAEGDPGPDVLADIAAGIEEDSFVPVRSLSGAFSAHSASAGAAYSQSYSLVNFLLDVHGREKMQALLLALADGETYDEALERVYGFNTDGLEQTWRAHIGAPARRIPPTPTPIDPAAVPTIAPLTVAQSIATPPSAAATAPPAEQPDGGVCAAGLVPLFFLLALSRAGPRQRRG